MDDNPFKDSATWLVEFKIRYKFLDNFVDYFNEFIKTISCSEDPLDSKNIHTTEPQDNDLWVVQLYYDNHPLELEVRQHLANIAEKHNVDIPKFSVTKVIDKDWVSIVQANSKPIQSGNYFIHNSNYEGNIPSGLHIIRIDAGRAFGTGEHETTSSCLLALSNLSQKYNFTNILDIGCGSGILSIAAAKAWSNSKVTSADIEEQAVEITRENAKINNVAKLIESFTSNGYDSAHLHTNGPYDLICSNILAKPLVDFAPYLYNNLQHDGIAVLSGMLVAQKKEVLLAHTSLGLSLIDSINNNNWITLILQKH